jgi:hypothetical protein
LISSATMDADSAIAANVSSQIRGILTITPRNWGTGTSPVVELHSILQQHSFSGGTPKGDESYTPVMISNLLNSREIPGAPGLARVVAGEAVLGCIPSRTRAILLGDSCISGFVRGPAGARRKAALRTFGSVSGSFPCPFACLAKAGSREAC